MNRLKKTTRAFESSKNSTGHAQLHSLENGIVYFAERAKTGVTRRHPGVILLSAPDAPMRLETQSRVFESSALAVAPRVPRKLTAKHSPFVAIHVEPSHKNYRAFERIRCKTGIKPLSHTMFSDFDSVLSLWQKKDFSSEDLNTLYEGIVGRLVETLGSAPARDERMERAMRITLGQRPEDYSFNDILGALGLSAGRFSHLFTEQIGLSLRSFLMWRKTKDALKRLASTDTLTEIAHSSGFSDSAHFCRTFQGSLGLPPSSFRGDSCIQVRDHALGIECNMFEDGERN